MKKTQEEREQELIRSGLLDYIKSIFANSNANIPDDYYMLIADYIDSLDKLNAKELFDENPMEIAKRMPKVLTEVIEDELGDVHGATNETKITMRTGLDYEEKRLYFFHELIHAIQTRKVGDKEYCGFSDGNTGMFFTEGATQYIAEMLYHKTNGTELDYRLQPGSVRGHLEHIPFSPLSNYQLNGCILNMFACYLGIDLNELLALSFKRDGRERLKEKFESLPGNEDKFESFMLDLEKIYTIDKLLFQGHRAELQGKPISITYGDIVFMGNLDIQGNLIDNIERELIAGFLINNADEFIVDKYNIVDSNITLPELRETYRSSFMEIYDSLAEENPNKEFPPVKF